MRILFIEIKLIYSIYWYYHYSYESLRFYDCLYIMGVDIAAILPLCIFICTVTFDDYSCSWCFPCWDRDYSYRFYIYSCNANSYLRNIRVETMINLSYLIQSMEISIYTWDLIIINYFVLADTIIILCFIIHVST